MSQQRVFGASRPTVTVPCLFTVCHATAVAQTEPITLRPPANLSGLRALIWSTGAVGQAQSISATPSGHVRVCRATAGGLRREDLLHGSSPWRSSAAKRDRKSRTPAQHSCIEPPGG